MRNDLMAAVDGLVSLQSYIETDYQEKYGEDYENVLGYAEDMNAFDTALTALREKQQRQPDPKTGLVPCGCGGKAHIINSSGYSRRLYVECDRCDIMLGVEATGDGALQGIYRYDDQIIKDWNLAMGWKGDAE